MKKFNVVTTHEVIGSVAPEIYGGFVEHLGRNVYGGVYDPEDPTADENGFRRDVLKCIRELDMPLTRYPGGCYTDTWRWEDGVGPRELRPVRLDAAWMQKEPNTFGLDEFVRWARMAGTEPVVTLNLSTRGIQEAEELWEYCNFPGGTALSDRRIRNGAEKPHNIRYWCLGNEQYGTWEVGHKNAADYAKLARETAKLLKMHDRDLKIILCGNPYDMDWNRTVLSECYMYVDFISLHELFNNKLPRADYFRKVDAFGEKIREIAVCCEIERKRRNTDKRLKISVVEWIVWNLDRTRRPGEEWTVGAHLLEQNYTMLDALEEGSIFSLFHNNADVVGMACVAQSINVIAPIRTEKNGVLWKQCIYDIFRLNSRYGRGRALRCFVESDDFGQDPAPAVSVIHDPAANTLTYFITVRSPDEIRFTAQPLQKGEGKILEAYSMHADDLSAGNGPGREILHAEKFRGARISGGALSVRLRPFSWNMIRVQLP